MATLVASLFVLFMEESAIWLGLKFAKEKANNVAENCMQKRLTHGEAMQIETNFPS